MQATEAVIFQMENAFLLTLINLLKKNEIKYDDAKRITTEFLALRPFTTIEDLKTKMGPFTDTYPQFKQSYIVVMQHEETEKTGALLSQMKEHMANNDIDKALQLVTDK